MILLEKDLYGILSECNNIGCSLTCPAMLLLVDKESDGKT